MTDEGFKAPHLYQVEDGWIELRSGQKFHFRSPDPALIDIEDIAAALSKLCRYNGHTREFYSVAEHSCHVMRHARSYVTPIHRSLLTALMHDAAEYVMADLPRPIKQTLPLYSEIELGLERVIAERFGLLTPPWPRWVKELDTRILVDERAQCMSDSGNEWGIDGLEPLGVEIRFWTPSEAEDNFLEDFYELTR